MNFHSVNNQHLETYRCSLKKKLNYLMSESQTKNNFILNEKKYKTEILNKLREKLLNIQDSNDDNNDNVVSRTITTDKDNDDKVLFGSNTYISEINEKDDSKNDDHIERKQSNGDDNDNSEDNKHDNTDKQTNFNDDNDENTDSDIDSEENIENDNIEDNDESLADDSEDTIRLNDENQNENQDTSLEQSINNENDIRDLATDTTIEVLQLIKDLRDKTKKENPQKAELIRKIYDYILKIKDKVAEEIIQSQEEKENEAS